MSIKIQLKEQAEKQVETKITKANQDLNVMYESLKEETKSSAGDKFETGRAMIHIEIDKLKTYVGEQKSLLAALQSILYEEEHTQIKNGSIVETKQANYWIVASIGKLTIGNKVFFALSSSAPLAKILIGKVQGDQVRFLENTIDILKVY